MTNRTYSARELMSLTGVSVRSLRYWVRLKLVPKPIGRGRGARYQERHLIRVRYVRHLLSQRVRMRAMRSRIGTKTDEQLLAELPLPPRAVTPEGVPLPPPAPTYPFTACEHVYLMDGLSLMVNPSFGPLVRRIADEIFRHYGMPAGQGAR